MRNDNIDKILKQLESEENSKGLKVLQQELQEEREKSKSLEAKLERARSDCEYIRTTKDALQKVIEKGVSANDKSQLETVLGQKDEQITYLQSQLDEKSKEIERLISINTNLKLKLDEFTSGNSWRTAVDTNKLKSQAIYAKILCYIIKGFSVSNTVKKLYEDCGMDISTKTVYRAISVKEDTDRARIFAILKAFPDTFKEMDTVETDVWEWFNRLRIKKLNLISETDLVKLYGKDIIQKKGITPDPFVDGKFYSLTGIDNIWGE